MLDSVILLNTRLWRSNEVLTPEWARTAGSGERLSARVDVNNTDVAAAAGSLKTVKSSPGL